MSDGEHLCTCLLDFCMSFLEKYFFFHFLCSFLNGLFFFFFFLTWSCMGSLYILYIKPLSYILFANIFSYSVGYIFILLMVFFAMQKIFSLI